MQTRTLALSTEAHRPVRAYHQYSVVVYTDHRDDGPEHVRAFRWHRDQLGNFYTLPARLSDQAHFLSDCLMQAPVCDQRITDDDVVMCRVFREAGR